MNLLKDPLHTLDALDYRPKRAEVPASVYPLHVTLGDLYGYALDLEEPDQCERQLRWLVIHNLHHRWIQTEEGQRGMTLAEAFTEERLALWFYALARDVRLGCYRVIEVLPGLTDTCGGIPHARWRRVEYQQWRRKAKALYGCVDPLGLSAPTTIKQAASRPSKHAAPRPIQQANLFGENSWP